MLDLDIMIHNEHATTPD